jgi:hypothetical protein
MRRGLWSGATAPILERRYKRGKASYFKDQIGADWSKLEQLGPARCHVVSAYHNIILPRPQRRQAVHLRSHN